jgi:hypothetical protein
MHTPRAAISRRFTQERREKRIKNSRNVNDGAFFVPVLRMSKNI